MALLTQVEALSRQIDARQVRLHEADRYYAGTQPLAYLSPAARKALGDRLASVAANYVKLATDSLAERLAVDGFRVGGQTLTDVWVDWRACGMDRAHRVAITEALVLGQAFLTCWADPTGAPVVTVDSPREVAVTRDPLSREVTTALKRWRDDDGTARAVLYAAETITLWRGPEVPEGGALPTTGWRYSDTRANPLGVVPVVELTNAGRLLDTYGTPEARDIWTLCDALAKLLSDVLVASEATALPRRWATGLQIVEDDDGNPVNPFSTEPGSVWQSESEATRFGSCPEPTLGGYGGLIEVILRQIGSIAGLPDHLMGFAGTEPSSAEQIRASESSLVARANARQVTFSPAFSKVAALVQAIRTGGRVRTDVEVVWASPESRTVAQAADAAAKVVAAGLLSVERAQAVYLGLTPAEVEAERAAKVRAALDAAPLTLPPAIPVGTSPTP
ncbi:phage portal protein [Microlunatus flavus]|uniref:Phage portal protein, SPP1 Gp6-like n=1 Tax=Microlunatus flavus TaxID=1036181 RepID=A0A1H9LM78_9ACTN|nr:phage portal protein [Microlunatus flavus]SER12235.1 Phage portal protein, SPP1 Gp6-like [Microlunatus flavus]